MGLAWIRWGSLGFAGIRWDSLGFARIRYDSLKLNALPVPLLRQVPENRGVHNIFFSRFLRHFWSLRGRLREPHFRSIFILKFCLFFIVILGSFWEPFGASDELALRAPRQLKIVVIFGSIFGAILE